MVAIDPGLNNIGIALYSFDLRPVRIRSIEAFTIKSDRVPDHIELDADTNAADYLKRLRMVRAVIHTVKRFNPSLVVSESPFFNHRTPGSFATLTLVMNDIFRECHVYDPNIGIASLAPLLVKQTLGVAGQKGKDVVKEALVSFSEIMEPLQTAIEVMDEHAIDAVAVGYTYFKRKILKEGKER